MMRQMASVKQPTYMQLVRSAVEPVFDDSYGFDPNRAVKLRDGKDVTLVTTGYMTQFTLKAADELKKAGIWQTCCTTRR